jgi:hypothetical protein
MRVRRTAITTRAGALSAAVLLLGLTACNTGFNGNDGVNGGSSPATSPVSQPGRYSGLPEPCGAPEQDRLAALLPGADAAALTGDSLATYDNGRRAACDWASEDAGTSYQLTVDFLRVISYDPEISDNDQAALDFADRADQAAIPRSGDTRDEDDGDAEAGPDDGDTAEPGATGDTGDTGEDPDTDESATGDGDDGSETGTATDPDDTTDPDADPDPGDGTGTGTAGEPAEDLNGATRPTGELAPRLLDGIGNAAYIDDRLSEDGTRREISLVFHTANVIVVIDYSMSAGEAARLPRSAALQETVRALAGQVTGRFED